MGRGIAKSFVSAGISTAILSRNVANVTAGVDERVALIEKLPPNAPGLIIEAVPEMMAVKLNSYAVIEAAYAGKPVLSSNTSTLDLEELARPLQHPERFLGIKSGKGFYDWSGKDPAEVKAEAARKLGDLLAYLKEHR